MREGDSIQTVISRGRMHPGGSGNGRADAAFGWTWAAGAPDACAGAGGAAAFLFDQERTETLQ
jgi:hypothetical protein